MPIANCILKHSLRCDDKDVVELWSKTSQVSSQEMTLNLLNADEQFGKPYTIMATLYLPSAWPQDKRDALQTGLSAALSKGFDQPIERVHVITLIVESGYVVENGQLQHW